MKIELRNISTNDRLSEETTCFSATVYIDGKKAFEASNRGQGGCNDYHAFGPDFSAGNKTIAAAEAWATAQPPISAYGMELPMDLDLYIGELIAAHQIEKDLKRALGAKVLFKVGDAPIREIKIKPHPLDKVKAFIRGKHANAVILNDLPLADALVIYRKQAA